MVTYEIRNEALVCLFSGSLNTAACWELEQPLLEKIEAEERPVVFDLEKVEYVSSAFLRMCLTVFKKVGSDNFKIVNMQPAVKQVYETAGFDQSMTIE